MLKVIAGFSYTPIQKGRAWEHPYCSPYSMDGKSPIPVIVVYNPSPYARTSAIDSLKRAFPFVTIVEVVSESQSKNPQSDYELKIKDGKESCNCANPSLIFTKLSEQYPQLVQVSNQKPGLYCGWSAQAENPEVARIASETGFKWIGANPDAMEILGTKIAYKQFCEKLGIKTSPFVVIAGEAQKVDRADKKAFDAYTTHLANAFIENYYCEKATKFNNGSVFIKSSEGGGGRGTVKVTDPTDFAQVKKGH